jgi:hypothetical protein
MWDTRLLAYNLLLAWLFCRPLTLPYSCSLTVLLLCGSVQQRMPLQAATRPASWT